MRLIDELKKNKSFLDKIYNKATDSKRTRVKSIIDKSNFKKDINNFMNKYKKFKNSNIKTKKIELTDNQLKELSLKYYPLFKSYNVDTKTYEKFKDKL